LLKGAEEYFKVNEYSSIEYKKKFEQGSLNFACKRAGNDEFDHVLVGVARPMITDYDLRFLDIWSLFFLDIWSLFYITSLIIMSMRH
jgi:hypothetical protein